MGERMYRTLIIFILLSGCAFADDFAVIYSENTGRIRQVVIADAFDKYTIAKGETMRLIDKSQYASIDSLQSIISNDTGLIPDDKYAVVDDKGNVTGIITADTSIDTMPGKELVKSNEAKPGYTYDKNRGFLDPKPAPVLTPRP